MNSHPFCTCLFSVFSLKRDAVTFEAMSQSFCSSDLLSPAPERKKKNVVVREHVSIGRILGGEKEYSEFFVDLIHAQHINWGLLKLSQ